MRLDINQDGINVLCDALIDVLAKTGGKLGMAKKNNLPKMEAMLQVRYNKAQAMYCQLASIEAEMGQEGTIMPPVPDNREYRKQPDGSYAGYPELPPIGQRVTHSVDVEV